MMMNKGAAMNDAADAIRDAEQTVFGGQRQEQLEADFFAAVAPFRPAFDEQGSPAEERRIAELVTTAKKHRPGLSENELETAARNHILWWRWPLRKQVIAWMKRKPPFDGGTW